MSIRKVLVKLKNDNPWIRLLWFHRLAIRAEKSKLISDEELISKKYKLTFGKEPDLVNPKTYYEKLNWLKLHYRNELMPIVADKFTVRKYLTDLGYQDLLNDIYGCWDKIEDFDVDSLPVKFVLKATHASGTAWFKIVMDNKKVNWFAYRKIMKQWLKQNIAWMGREWHYAGMTPRIIAEKFLKDESGELRDYKFHCFNGEPKFVSIFTGRFTKNKMELVHDFNGKLLPFTSEAIDLLDENPDFHIPFPDNFEKMKKIAEDLCKPFPMVRVDFYCVNGKIYFGEFTFFDGSGLVAGYTDEAQLKIGAMLILPEANC